MRFLKDLKKLKEMLLLENFIEIKKKIQLSFWLKKKETRIF